MSGLQDLDPFNPINIQLHKHHHTVNFYFIPYIFCTTLINLTTIRPPKKDKKATLTCFSPQILQIHWRIQLPPPKKNAIPFFLVIPASGFTPSSPLPSRYDEGLGILTADQAPQGTAAGQPTDVGAVWHQTSLSLVIVILLEWDRSGPWRAVDDHWDPASTWLPWIMNRCSFCWLKTHL